MEYHEIPSFITENSVMLIWEAAIPLSSAALQFAPEEIRTEWAQLSKRNAIAEGTEAVKNLATGVSWSDIMGAFLSSGNEIEAPKRNLVKIAQNGLLEHIKAGRVFGLGFEPPRRVSSLPVQIPAKCWSQFVIWERSEINYQTLKFVDVRLFTQKMALPVLQKLKAQEISLTPTTPKPKPKPIGRPSVKAHVQNAFIALDEAGQIDPNKTGISHYDAIRRWIGENTSYDGDGLGREGIREHFSPLFSELKNSRKQ